MQSIQPLKRHGSHGNVFSGLPLPGQAEPAGLLPRASSMRWGRRSLDRGPSRGDPFEQESIVEHARRELVGKPLEISRPPQPVSRRRSLPSRRPTDPEMLEMNLVTPRVSSPRDGASVSPKTIESAGSSRRSSRNNLDMYAPQMEADVLRSKSHKLKPLAIDPGEDRLGMLREPKRIVSLSPLSTPTKETPVELGGNNKHEDLQQMLSLGLLPVISPEAEMTDGGLTARPCSPVEGADDAGRSFVPMLTTSNVVGGPIQALRGLKGQCGSPCEPDAHLGSPLCVDSSSDSFLRSSGDWPGEQDVGIYSIKS